MRKRKIKNYFKFGILLIGILFTLTNCDKDHLTETSNTEDLLATENNIAYVSQKEIPHIIKVITALTGESTFKSTSNLKSIKYKKAQIDVQSVLKVKNKQNFTNFTFNVLVDNAPANEFYNLVVREDSDKKIKKPFIIKYVVDNDALALFEAKKGDFGYFKGKRYIISFESFFNDFDLKNKTVSDPCPQDPYDYIIEINNLPRGVNGSFYNISLGDLIQVDPNSFLYGVLNTSGFYTFYLNGFNPSTQQPTSYGAVVNNQYINVSYGTSPLAPVYGGSSIGTLSITIQPNSGSGGGDSTITKCSWVIIQKYNLDSRSYTVEILEICREIPVNRSANTSTSDCPDPQGEIGVIISRCMPGFIKDVNGNCVPIPCETGYTKDVNGNCVPVSLPCINIKNQLNNTAYKEKVEELKGKTHLKHETGYAEDKEGNITPLPLLDGGHSLDLKVGLNTKGYIHSHQNDFLTGKIVDGKNEIAQPIRMFSSADIIKLLNIAKNTLRSNIPLDEVYGTMISSTGNYTLKFTGNIDHIHGFLNANDLRDVYIGYIKEFGLEEGFLKFIKNEIKIDGISLYKIEDNGQIIQKTIDNNGIIVPVNCN
ncbi:MAG: hypothetical protein Q8J84_04025 [Flavobacteriaceae bacterium]|nr:hypothetical protein [Flavobacteriaceae bacterium]